MADRFKVEGLKALDEALGQFSKPMARATLVRALRKAAEPIRDAAQAYAPELTHALEESIVTGTRLTPRQRRLLRKEAKDFAEVYVGTSDPAAVPQEFGTVNQPAQPFMRPAWDGNKAAALASIRGDLATEIAKTAARVRKRKG